MFYCWEKWIQFKNTVYKIRWNSQILDYQTQFCFQPNCAINAPNNAFCYGECWYWKKVPDQKVHIVGTDVQLRLEDAGTTNEYFFTLALMELQLMFFKLVQIQILVH